MLIDQISFRPGAASSPWLLECEELGRNIEQNKRIGRYNADGYDEETNTAYEDDEYQAYNPCVKFNFK